MRRILSVLTVAALMAAMLAVTTGPAFAVGKAQCGIGAIESEGTTQFFEPPTNTLGAATSGFAQFQKAIGSNLGETVTTEEPAATRCSQNPPAPAR